MEAHMTTKSKLVAAAGVGLLAMAATASARDARAQSCGGGYIDWYANERANVAQAEQMMSEGHAHEAAWLIQRTWPYMHDAVPVASSMPQIAEGVRIMALAAVRTDGNIETGLGWASRTPLERSLNVRWGVSRLRMLVSANADSDAAKTDLGEVLARAPETRGEARQILEGLASRNAVGTAEGWAALARLRQDAGDTNGAAVASRTCEAQAAHADVQCATPAAVVVATR
jgi:hypothetical protein